MLFILDCCFSGVAATTARATPAWLASESIGDSYLRRITGKKAWQVLTAGDSDDLAADSGFRPGHSAFTGVLLEGLGGNADLNKDGLITAGELAAYIKPLVTRETSLHGGKGQTPFFNYLVGSDQGDFVFEWGSSQLLLL